MSSSLLANFAAQNAQAVTSSEKNPRNCVHFFFVVFAAIFIASFLQKTHKKSLTLL